VLTDQDRPLVFADLLPHLATWGITRVADTTGLDLLETPTASATKPGTRDTIWVYSGKALDQDQARVVAVMECLERTASLWPSEGWTVATEAELRSRGGTVWGPDRFTERKRPTFTADVPLAWTRAHRHSDDEPVWVPAHLVHHGSAPDGVPPSPFEVTTSNGLGAHPDPYRALAHALLEVIERHVVSVLEVRASHASYISIAGLARELGLRTDLLDGFVDDVDLAPAVDPATLPPELAGIVARYTRAGLTTTIKRLPNSFGLPVYGVAAIEQVGVDEFLGCAGYGARPGEADALRSALLELAQTRATDLQGAREDRHEVEKQRLTSRPDTHWLATPSRDVVPFPGDAGQDGPAPVAVPSVEHCDRVLAAAGFRDWCRVSFPAYPGVACCRVLVPGLETWHATGGVSELGPELRRETGAAR
jgi:ribosomal protein S12 methylthiotransferase accessory factor YcaO